MIKIFRLTAIAALLVGSAEVFATGNTVRPEVGTPLQRASSLIEERKFQEALSQVDAAGNVARLTSYERYIVERVRASAATAAGDYPTAIRAYEAALESPHLEAAEKPALLEVLVQLALTTKDYGKTVKAIQQYQSAGGDKAEILELLPQALYLADRHDEAADTLNRQLAAIEREGRTPTEAQLRLLANIAVKSNDNAGYASALEKLVTYHPSHAYWLDLILRTANQPGFSDRLSLDVYRLRFKTGTLESANDYVEAAQLALQDGLPGEAQQFIEAGYRNKVLGSGNQTDVDRHKRLADLVAARVAEDRQTLAQGIEEARRQESGDALVASGLNLLGYGDHDQGLQLIEEGIAKGKLRNPGLARLHLGYAYLKAGKNGEAVEVLREVDGSDGSAELSRLWIAHQARDA